MIKTINDRYDGIIIDETTLPHTKNEFIHEIEGLIESFKHKKLIWIRITI